MISKRSNSVARVTDRHHLRPVLVVAAVALAFGLLLAGCGEEESGTPAGAGSEQSASGDTSSSPSTTGDQSGDNAGGSGSDSSGQPTTTASSDGPVGQAEQAVNAAVSSGPWAESITGVAVSPGEELIVSVSANDESLPALEVCEAVRSALDGVDAGAGATVNVFFAPDLVADGGDERVLATSLGGTECESVRSAE